MVSFNSPIYSQGGRATGSLSGWERDEDVSSMTLQEVNYSVDDLIKKLKEVQDQQEGDKLSRLTSLLSKHIQDHDNPHRDTLAMLDPDVVNGFIAPYFPGSVPQDPPIYSLNALSSLTLDIPSVVDTSDVVYDITHGGTDLPQNALDNYITFNGANTQGGTTLAALNTSAYPTKASINRQPVFVVQGPVRKGTTLSMGSAGVPASIYSLGVNMNLASNSDGSLTIKPVSKDGNSIFNIECYFPSQPQDSISTLSIGTLRNLNLDNNFIYCVFYTNSGAKLVVKYNPIVNGQELCEVVYSVGNLSPVFDNNGVVFGAKTDNTSNSYIGVSISTTTLQDWSTYQPTQAVLDNTLFSEALVNIGNPCLKIFDSFIDFINPKGLVNQNSIIDQPDDDTLKAINTKTKSNMVYYTLPALSRLEVSSEWTFDISVIAPTFLENNNLSYPVFLSDGLTIYLRGQKNETKNSFTQALTWTVTVADTSNNKAVFNTTVNATANEIQTLVITYKNGEMRARVSGNSNDTSIDQDLFVVPLSNSILPAGIPLGFYSVNVYDCSDNDDTLSFIIGDTPSIQNTSTGVQ